MNRIPEQEIERLKREISVAQLARAAGVELKQHGEELLGLCPFHDDKNPSLVVNEGKNLWHCLGACQAGGSVIDWVMKVHGVSFRHAVEILRSGSHKTAAKEGNGKRTPQMKAAVTFDGDAQAVLQQVVEYYHKTLKESPEALAYLESRGLKSSEMIERFKLGFANRTLGYHLPGSSKAEGAKIRGHLRDIGILKKSGHEFFRGSLVIPVIGDDGVITEVYGRKVGERLREGTPLHLYLPGPHRGVWNVEALMASDEIILCESLIDALTFWCAGLRNVTCSYGIEGFTDDHIEAFRLYGIQKVMIAYDRDAAGERAAVQLAERLVKEEEISCFRVLFTKDTDANEFALKGGDLELAVKNAVWLGGGQPVTVAAPKAEQPATETQPCVTADVRSGEVVIGQGDRRWRIRGLEKNMSLSQLRVNVLVSLGESFFVDTLDMYSARHRGLYVKQAAADLDIGEDILKKDLGRVLLKLEELQEQQISSAMEAENKEVILSAEEELAALELLKSPQLLDLILEDFDKCGVVGEHTNKLVGYLAAVSRKLEEPLAVVIQSSSAAGKSSLMEAILSFLPAEQQVKYSAMTGQSLFYMGETNLKHKILAIAEEEGAQQASYALKLLQSEGELTIASTGKDSATGRMITHEYRVEGPVMIFLTTTAIEIDEELLNRCMVLTVDENRSQTRAIHQLQRERQTLEGLLARKESNGIRALHQNAQRLLRPLLVANPFARELTFLDDRTRTRRDHMKYLTLIRAIALLHQYQRPVKRAVHNGESVEYIEVTLADIEVANGLCHQVLGRSLDELAPQTRRLLVLLDEMVRKRCEAQGVDRDNCWFTRREVREYTGLGNTQTRIHLDRLVALEYVILHHGGRGQQFVYELVFDGDVSGDAHLNGLIDIESLKSGSTASTWRGKESTLRGHDGPTAGGSREADRAVLSNDSAEVKPLNGKSLKNTYAGDGNADRTVVLSAREMTR